MQQSAKTLLQNQPLRKNERTRIDESITSKKMIKRLIEDRLQSAVPPSKSANGPRILPGAFSNPIKRNASSQSQSRIVVRTSKRPESFDKTRHLRANSLKSLARPVETAFEQRFQNIKDELKAETRISRSSHPKASELDQHLRLVKQYLIDESKISKKPVEKVKAYGANTHQGIVRNYNEDRVSIVTHFGLDKSSSFFAVYDGHGGTACADYLRDNMHKLLSQQGDLVSNPKQALRTAILKA